MSITDASHFLQHTQKSDSLPMHALELAVLTVDKNNDGFFTIGSSGSGQAQI